MAAAGLLTKLERLAVCGPMGYPWDISFNSLVQLRALREVEFLRSTDNGYRVTPEQLRCLMSCLSNCPTLEVLSCGRWDADSSLFKPACRAQAPNEETQLAQTIGAIVNTIEARRQGASAAGCTFRKLTLAETDVSCAVLWAPLVQRCTAASVTQLELRCRDCGI